MVRTTEQEAARIRNQKLIRTHAANRPYPFVLIVADDTNYGIEIAREIRNIGFRPKVISPPDNNLYTEIAEARGLGYRNIALYGQGRGADQVLSVAAHVPGYFGVVAEDPIYSDQCIGHTLIQMLGDNPTQRLFSPSFILHNEEGYALTITEELGRILVREKECNLKAEVWQESMPRSKPQYLAEIFEGFNNQRIEQENTPKDYSIRQLTLLMSA